MQKNKKTFFNIESTVYKNKEIDDVDLDGEKVMMDLEKGRYFMMNQVGSRIWELIENPLEVNEIVNALLQEYDVSRDTCEKEVMNFLNKLNNANLIVLQ